MTGVNHEWEWVPCPLCAGRDSKLLFLDRLTWKDRELIFRLVECLNCGLWFVNPRNLTDAGKFYRDDVSWEQLERWVEEQGVHKQRLADKLLCFAARFLEERKLTERRLLDIGCGVGYFLDYARRRGYETYGVEISRPEAEYARQRFKVEVFCGQLERSPFPDGSFQVVTMLDVLEHLSNPLEVLRTVCSKLQPGGLLILRSANGRFALLKARLFSRLIPGAEYLLHPNEHLIQPTSRILTMFLNKAGFRVLRIDNGWPEYVPYTFRRAVRIAWGILSRGICAVSHVYFSNSLDVFAVRNEGEQ